MDVCGIYVGDAGMSFGSVRSTYYRDYEQFPYGTLENSSAAVYKDSYSRVQEKCLQTKAMNNVKKECPFCKEQKKRPLTKYLRILRKHKDSICEEDENDLTSEHTHDNNKQ